MYGILVTVTLFKAATTVRYATWPPSSVNAPYQKSLRPSSTLPSPPPPLPKKKAEAFFLHGSTALPTAAAASPSSSPSSSVAVVHAQMPWLAASQAPGPLPFFRPQRAQVLRTPLPPAPPPAGPHCRALFVPPPPEIAASGLASTGSEVLHPMAQVAARNRRIVPLTLSLSAEEATTSSTEVKFPFLFPGSFISMGN